MMRRGITIVEVVGCVAVVGCVTAFLIPLVGRGQVNAARSSCMANMKQIGAGVMLYAADCDDVLPITTERKPRLGFGQHWSRSIQPYVASLEMFVCPSDAQPSRPTYQNRSIAGQVPLISYVNNYAAIAAHDFYPVPRSVLTAPEHLILIAERRAKTYLIGSLPAWKGTSGFFPGQPCSDQKFGPDYTRVTPEQARTGVAEVARDDRLLLIRVDWGMHDQGANYTFADGHAAFQTLEQTLDPRDYQWGERFYPRSQPEADCDGRARRKTPARPQPLL